uniref:Glyoxalase domain containing 4 n=1 Tax=Panthera tigris altaica TaxID=74533 RepID=A0A8C9ME74_PANTA
MASRRALHFVFKVGNRFQTTHFFRDVLGMKVVLNMLY